MSEEIVKAKTAEERIQEVTARRAAKEDAELAARREQFANDLEAIEELEKSKGIRIRYSKQVRTFVPGLPVVVGVRAPDVAEYKRLVSKVNRANGNGDAKVAALIELANACWAYPDPTDDKAKRDAMVEANAGLLASVGNFANTLAEVELKEEGKE